MWQNRELHILERSQHLITSTQNIRNITLFDKYLIAVGAAREYHSRDWESQSILGISTQLLNTSPPLLLRDSTSAEIFVCLFQLAKACGDRQLDQIIQNAWLTRIRSHQLSPIPAILLADDYACRDFLSATLYEYLITVEPLISSSRRIDGDSPLSYNQNLHIFQGYYSLSAYWTELCQEPLGFLHGQKCLCNRDCREMWRSRWLPVACQLSPGCSPVDLLRRLWSVEKMMREDKLLCACMTKECKESALGALLQKRRNVSKNMYHYFDL